MVFEDFEDGILDPNFHFLSGGPVSAHFGPPDATVTRQAGGGGNGFGNIRTRFALRGDFRISVDIDRSNINGAAPGNAFAGIRLFEADVSGAVATPLASSATIRFDFLNDNKIQNVNKLPPSGFGLVSKTINDSRDIATFVLEREGFGQPGAPAIRFCITSCSGPGANVLTDSVNINNGSGADFLVDFSLAFLNGYSSQSSVVFDNILIEADEFSGQFSPPNQPVPIPASIGLLMGGLALMFAYRRRNTSR